MDLLGKEGVTVTELHPVGVGLFEGRRLDIIAEGEFIKEQTAVKVISARGARVVVRSV
jgi:membrane-bound serine protease (ClpP class)